MTRGGTLLASLSILVAVALVSGPASGETGDGPPAPRITFHKNAAGVRGVKLRLYLKTEPRRVWDVVTSPAKAASLFRDVASIEGSRRGKGFWDYHLSSILGEKVVTCRISRDDARQSIQWKRVDGHLVELYGYYKLAREERFPGYTKVDYASYIDPGGIGRVMMTNGKRKVAVDFMIARLRRLTE